MGNEFGRNKNPTRSIVLRNLVQLEEFSRQRAGRACRISNGLASRDGQSRERKEAGDIAYGQAKGLLPALRGKFRCDGRVRVCNRVLQDSAEKPKSSAAVEAPEQSFSPCAGGKCRDYSSVFMARSKGGGEEEDSQRPGVAGVLHAHEMQYCRSGSFNGGSRGRIVVRDAEVRPGQEFLPF